MKLITRLRGIAIALFIVCIIHTAFIYLQVRKMTDDGRVVNHAGVVRGTGQRLIKLELAGQPQNELMATVDPVINGLIRGDRQLQLPPATDPQFLVAMGEVERAWAGLQRAVREARRDPAQHQNLLRESEVFFELTNRAVNAAEAMSRAKVQTLQTIVLLLFAVNLAVIAGIWVNAGRVSSRLEETIATTSSTSAEISAQLAQQERTAAQQAAAVHETSTTMDELDASARQSAQQSEAVAEKARRALTLAEEGRKVVEHTLSEMSTLGENVRAISQQILSLTELTNQVGNVSGLVSDLATQTNLLALNAGVEAARAGDHGRGFAVVAVEIRKLADQSKKSAERISALVTDIQRATHSTVMITEVGTKSVAEGTRLVQETGASFHALAASITSAFESTQQITLNIRQQAIAFNQIVQSMGTMNSGARETAAGLAQTKVGIERLQETVRQLQAQVV